MKDDPFMAFVQASYSFQAMLNKQLKDSGLSDVLQPGMGPILFALEKNDGCNLKTLVEITKRSMPTLSNTLKRMKSKGLVQTVKDPEDKRAMCITMTTQSKKMMPKLHAAHEAMLQVCLANVPKKDYANLKKLLGGMSDSMRAFAGS